MTEDAAPTMYTTKNDLIEDMNELKDTDSADILTETSRSPRRQRHDLR